MKIILALALLLAIIAPLASAQNDVRVVGNADVVVTPDTNPDVVVVPEDKPDVVVQEKRDVEVVPTPAGKNEVNIPGFEAAFAAVGILAALRALRRKD